MSELPWIFLKAPFLSLHGTGSRLVRLNTKATDAIPKKKSQKSRTFSCLDCFNCIISESGGNNAAKRRQNLSPPGKRGVKNRQYTRAKTGDHFDRIYTFRASKFSY